MLFIPYGGENTILYDNRFMHKNATLMLNHDNFSEIEVAQPANLTVLELNYTVNFENANQVSVFTITRSSPLNSVNCLNWRVFF